MTNVMKNALHILEFISLYYLVTIIENEIVDSFWSWNATWHYKSRSLLIESVKWYQGHRNTSAVTLSIAPYDLLHEIISICICSPFDNNSSLVQEMIRCLSHYYTLAVFVGAQRRFKNREWTQLSATKRRHSRGWIPPSASGGGGRTEVLKCSKLPQSSASEISVRHGARSSVINCR